MHFFKGLIGWKHLHIFDGLKHQHQLLNHLFNSHARFLIIVEFQTSSFDIEKESEEFFLVFDGLDLWFNFHIK